MGKATQDLKKEHNAILHVLKILDKMMLTEVKEDNVKIQYYREMAHFFRIFADKCHHGKEESFLFQELVKNGIPKDGGVIEVLLKEHDQGREFLALINQSLDAEDITAFNDTAAKYRDLLKRHIEKEENFLFGIADQLLDEEKQEELFRKFEEYEENIIGNGVHEQLYSMIHKWATEFEVNNK